MTKQMVRLPGLLWLTAFLLAIVVVACGGGSGSSGGSGTSDKPVSGGTLTLAMASDVVTFDPLKATDVFSSTVTAQVVEALFDVGRDTRVVGRLVETSENPEPHVYVWKLRKGIKFTDGTDFDSEVVKFNIERHRNPDNKSVRQVDVKDIVSVEAPDPSTVRITLRAPDRSFLDKFTSNAGRMLNPKAVAALGENLQRNLTDAGTGPFKLVKWDKDTRLVLQRNPNYWQKDAAGNQLPYLDELIFTVHADENTRLTNLRTGDADALVGNPPYKDINDLKNSSEISLNEIPGLGFSVIELNTLREPFSNAALRRAVSFGLDRGQIKKTVFFDTGRELDTAMPESLSYWYQKEASYHPYVKQDGAAVKRELAAAGKPGGFKFTLQITAGSPTVEQSATLIQDQLKPFGIEVEIVRLEFATILANARVGADGKPANFDALILSWSGFAEPDRTFTPLGYTKAGSNFTGFSSADLDKAIDDGRNLLDSDKAKAAYDRAVKIMNEHQPFIVYYNLPQVIAARKNVRDFPQSYNGYWGASDLYRTWKVR